MMSIKPLTRLPAIVILAGALTAQTSSATALLSENFYSNAKMGPETTADWSTINGWIGLHEAQMVIAPVAATSGPVQDVATDGERLYLAAWTGGLLIYDRPIPFEPPSLLGSYSTPGQARAVAVDGKTAFVAAGTSGLQIVDVSTPAVPVLRGSLSLAGTTTDVALWGSYAVVLHQTVPPLNFNYLRVIDVSDPTGPVSVGSVVVGGAARRVCLAGDLAYITNSLGVKVVSLRNPTAPVVLGSVSTVGDNEDIVVAGDRAYVADNLNGVVVLDISDPTAPAIIATAATPAAAYGVVLDGDYLYVVATYGGLLEFDVRDPAAPVLLETQDTPGSALAVTVLAPQVFVADDSGGLATVDVTRENIFNPNWEQVGSAALGGAAGDVAVAGDVAYVADGSAGVLVLDIAQPETPMVIGQFNSSGSAQGLCLAGNLLYLADGAAGLVVLDVTNPALPGLMGDYNTNGNAVDVIVVDQTAYVADGTSLQVIDVSAPTAPAYVDRVAIAAWGVDAAGGFVYVASGNAGTKILDASGPGVPVVIGTAPGVFTEDVAVSGSDLFAATGGLLWYDVSNPAFPVFKDAAVGTNNVRGVALNGSFVLALQRFDTSPLTTGVNVYQRDNRFNVFRPVGFFETDSEPMAAVVHGDHIFTAVRPNAISVLDGLHVERFHSRYLDEFRDLGQSLPLGSAWPNSYKALLLTTDQVGDVTWRVSGNNIDWQDVTPGVWEPLVSNWNSVSWQSHHTYAHDGLNPICSTLTMNMLFDVPYIVDLVDVPGDQGGFVQLTWVRSGYDLTGADYLAASYQVFRQSHANPLQWDLVGGVAATEDQQYTLTVPTVADSSLVLPARRSVYTVRVNVTGLGTPFESAPDSLFSVDDIGPGRPSGLIVRYGEGGGIYNYLGWDSPGDVDLYQFRIYRSDVMDFAPGPATLVDAVPAAPSAEWKDPGAAAATVYYRVAAVDSAGNEGPAAMAEALSGVAEGTPIQHLALYQNQPNPFNPSTSIAFDVPRDGLVVEVAIFDVRGRRVRQLSQGPQARGHITLIWDGRNDVGQPMVSGVYFCRLTAGGEQLTQKLLMVK